MASRKKKSSDGEWRWYLQVLLAFCVLSVPGLSPLQVLPCLSSSPADSSIARPEIGFGTRQKLSEHYRKHGKEFGQISKEEYLRRAQELRDRPSGGDILEAVRKDGVVTRFDRKTGAFLAFNPDGTIRTFFRPNEGERYFRRQAQRNAGEK
jgi:pyocin large subunit-like protein